MNATIGEAIENRSIKSRLEGEGFELVRMTPPQFAALVAADIATWAPLARRLTSAEPAR